MTVRCRDGHVSDEPDYCSVCGAPIGGAATSTAAAGGIGITSCPACGEPREAPDARFCEVCRFDFVANKPGPPPVARNVAPPPSATAKAAPPPLPKAAQPPPLPVASPAPVTAWELCVAIDPTLDTEPDPESPCPVGTPDRIIAVGKGDLLVGRHDETRDIHPEIPLHDPGASRRHAKFVLEQDGGVALQDLASTNGTEVNGKAVPPGTRRKLAEGDAVTLGRWTRITLRGQR